MVVSNPSARRYLDRREGWKQRVRVEEQEDYSTECEQKLGQDPVVTKQAPSRTECLDEARQHGRDAERQNREPPYQLRPDTSRADDAGVLARKPRDRQDKNARCRAK